MPPTQGTWGIYACIGDCTVAVNEAGRVLWIYPEVVQEESIKGILISGYIAGIILQHYKRKWAGCFKLLSANQS
jgi:hypothetical protein